MKKLIIQTDDFFKDYLVATRGITGISDKEISILCEFNNLNHIKIENPSIKKQVADNCKIEYKTLNIFLRNMLSKEILVSNKRGVYELSQIAKPEDTTLIWKKS
jgi:hypothetical protein